MELLGTFETVAQIAITLTGFTGVVVALGRRELSEWAPTERFLLQSLLYWSLGTVFLAFLPAGLSGLARNTAWRVAHTAFFLFHASVFVWYFHHARLEGFFASVAARISTAFGAAVLLAEASVALGFFLRAAPHLYLLALVWFLYLAATAFIGLVFSQDREAS